MHFVTQINPANTPQIPPHPSPSATPAGRLQRNPALGGLFCRRSAVEGLSHAPVNQLGRSTAATRAFSTLCLWCLRRVITHVLASFLSFGSVLSHLFLSLCSLVSVFLLSTYPRCVYEISTRTSVISILSIPFRFLFPLFLPSFPLISLSHTASSPSHPSLLSTCFLFPFAVPPIHSLFSPSSYSSVTPRVPFPSRPAQTPPRFARRRENPVKKFSCCVPLQRPGCLTPSSVRPRDKPGDKEADRRLEQSLLLLLDACHLRAILPRAIRWRALANSCKISWLIPLPPPVLANTCSILLLSPVPLPTSPLPLPFPSHPPPRVLSSPRRPGTSRRRRAGAQHVLPPETSDFAIPPYHKPDIEEAIACRPPPRS